MSDTLEYDVLVIGGGPAGSTAGRFSARNGARTLVIEKRQEIGSPVRCGEGISLSWLDELDIKDVGPWVSRYMNGARIYSPSGYVLEIVEEYAGDEVGCVIERDLFDKDMARRAAMEGADFMVKTAATGLLWKDGCVVGARVKQLGREFDIKAKIIIGADGFESQVGRWAGIYTAIPPKDIMTCFQYRMTGIDVDPDYTHFFMGSGAPGGYAWIFPKDERTANVGLGVQFSRLDGSVTPKDYLDRFIAGHEGLKNGEAIDMVAGAVSVAHPPERSVADGIMLVGDASRVVDPITGGGIINGMKQARMAGELAAEAVDQGRSDHEYLKRYEKRWRERFENKLWRNYMAKEKAMQLDDVMYDKIVDALSELDLRKVRVETILEGVRRKYPELIKEFEDMM